MVDCVFRHDGTLDKFIGDAVMAQWGAPIGDAADPDRAVRAAIDMIRELDTLNARWRAEGRPELQIGIGINYGDAFAGNIGSEKRLEFTVIGDTVNTASRLCSVAGPREILISESLRRALSQPAAVGAAPAHGTQGQEPGGAGVPRGRVTVRPATDGYERVAVGRCRRRGARRSWSICSGRCSPSARCTTSRASGRTPGNSWDASRRTRSSRPWATA